METDSYREIRSALGRNRTCDQEIRRLLLYPLSYEGNWKQREFSAMALRRPTSSCLQQQLPTRA